MAWQSYECIQTRHWRSWKLSLEVLVASSAYLLMTHVPPFPLGSFTVRPSPIEGVKFRKARAVWHEIKEHQPLSQVSVTHSSSTFEHISSMCLEIMQHISDVRDYWLLLNTGGKFVSHCDGGLSFIHILPPGWAQALHQQTSIYENKSQGVYSSTSCHWAPSSTDTVYPNAKRKGVIGWPVPRGTWAAPCHWQVTKFSQRHKYILAEKLGGPSCKGNLVVPRLYQAHWANLHRTSYWTLGTTFCLIFAKFIQA